MIELRQKLHQFPELAFNEHQTSQIIKEYILQFNPDQSYENIEGTGLIFIFKGIKNKPKIIFRADLDALPINEKTTKAYVSRNKGCAHSCGHDGHMSMVAGIAGKLKSIQDRGDVILLFQPAEEIGAGAIKMRDHQVFKDLNADYIFGLHNLPEYPQGKILLRKGTFACSSIGLNINIIGQSSHAADPDAAIDPMEEFEQCKIEIKKINNNILEKYFLSTLTYLKLGHASFGITPGDLNCYFTLRAVDDIILSTNKLELLNIISKYYEKRFKIEIIEQEYFPATINHNECVSIIDQSAKDIDLDIEYLNEPLKWSEDFGYYTQDMPGAYLGLGLGITSQLHYPDYDFNDEVLDTGINLYTQIIKNINRSFNGI